MRVRDPRTPSAPRLVLPEPNRRLFKPALPFKGSILCRLLIFGDGLFIVLLCLVQAHFIAAVYCFQCGPLGPGDNYGHDA